MAWFNVIGMVASSVAGLAVGALSRRKQMEEKEKESSTDDAEVLFVLGQGYFIGNGVARDFRRGVEIWKRAAELGSADAHFMLAKYYYETVIDNRCDEGIFHYTKAAEQNHVKAIFCLGDCYLRGCGVDVDEKKGLELIKKSAELGYAAAYVDIANFYFFGEYGFAQDYKKAFELYQKSLDLGQISSIHIIGECYEFGYGVPVDMQQAFNLYMRAAELGMPQSQSKIGDYYYTGFMLQQDYKQAVKWYSKSSDTSPSMFGLGRCYYYGHGVPQSFSLAKKFIGDACKHGLPCEEAQLFWDKHELWKY